jgi:4-carboxymuconolactone decarboxylase
MVEVPKRPEYDSDLFKKGLSVRREVLGADYVDASLVRADDFNAAFQQMTTEIAWGMCWTRPGIDRKTRSMINLTMLSALNRGSEPRLHLRAALTNGVTRDEIKEILMQVGAYCGIPASSRSPPRCSRYGIRTFRFGVRPGHSASSFRTQTYRVGHLPYQRTDGR